MEVCVPAAGGLGRGWDRPVGAKRPPLGHFIPSLPQTGCPRHGVLYADRPPSPGGRDVFPSPSGSLTIGLHHPYQQVLACMLSSTDHDTPSLPSLVWAGGGECGACPGLCRVGVTAGPTL